LFGDANGIPQLLKHIPNKVIVGIVGAVIRPQYIDELQLLAGKMCVPFAIQPKPKSGDYLTFRKWVTSLKPDLIWVNSYSMIIREDVLSIPRLGSLNIHGALIPQYRGCNTTQWAILNGESRTGVTLHEMSAGLDEGDIIDQEAVPLFFEDTWESASRRIAEATDKIIEKNLPSILSGTWQASPQDQSCARYHRRRTPDDGLFSWDQPVIEIYNLIRALVSPLPGAFYEDEEGNRVVLGRYHSPSEIVALKYGTTGGGQMLAERVRLRPLQREDAGFLYQWITDRELFILNAPYHHISEADHEQWLESMMHKRSDLVIFVIEESKMKRAIGTCQLLNMNWRHRSAELKIRIGEDDNHGKDLGTEAIHLLTEFGFRDLNLHRIYLHVFATNKRAISAYEKSGFQQEGILRKAACIDGEWVDVKLMGLLQENHG
jgi:methionyl-tRNA formyltransferase